VIRKKRVVLLKRSSQPPNGGHQGPTRKVTRRTRNSSRWAERLWLVLGTSKYKRNLRTREKIEIVGGAEGRRTLHKNADIEEQGGKATTIGILLPSATFQRLVQRQWENVVDDWGNALRVIRNKCLFSRHRARDVGS